MHLAMSRRLQFDYNTVTLKTDRLRNFPLRTRPLNKRRRQLYAFENLKLLFGHEVRRLTAEQPEIMA